MIGEIAFIGGAAVILLAAIGLYFAAIIYGIGKALLIASLSLSMAGTGISIKKFIDYNEAHASEIHSAVQVVVTTMLWGDDD